MTMRVLPLLAVLSLSACAVVPVPVVLPVPAPKAEPAGEKRVIGKDAGTVTALLGSPTLDRSEGPARVLQFARAGCVLDLYLYPEKAGGMAATETAARTPEGRETDAGRCIEAQVAAHNNLSSRP